MNREQELANSEEFIAKFANTETPEEALELLEENGLSMTMDQLMAAVEAANADPNEELSEEALTSVSGGFLGTAVVCSAILYAGHKALEVTGGYKWYKSKFKKLFGKK